MLARIRLECGESAYTFYAHHEEIILTFDRGVDCPVMPAATGTAPQDLLAWEHARFDRITPDLALPDATVCALRCATWSVTPSRTSEGRSIGTTHPAVGLTSALRLAAAGQHRDRPHEPHGGESPLHVTRPLRRSGAPTVH